MPCPTTLEESVPEKRTAVSMFPLIEKYLAGNSTQKQFCRQHNLKLWAFHYWLKKYRRQAPGAAPTFLPIQLSEESSVEPGSACEIVLPTGIVVRFPASAGFSPEQLAHFITALEI